VEWEAQKVYLAERMGWTLDYIDEMPFGRFVATLEYLRAKDKASR
jgi:hypothetical protein